MAGNTKTDTVSTVRDEMLHASHAKTVKRVLDAGAAYRCVPEEFSYWQANGDVTPPFTRWGAARRDQTD